MGPLISVIVPIYNSERFLAQCIDSIVNQTYKNIEIILVDDGSTDSSGRVCDLYKEKDSRIQVIHKENGGVVSARKAGLQIATGVYTTAVDSDDWIDNDMYEKLVEILQKTKAQIVTSGAYVEYEYSSMKRYDNLEEGVYDIQNAQFLRNNLMIDMDTGEYRLYMAIWNKLIQREIFSKCYCEIDDHASWAEDMSSVIASILSSDRIAISHEAFYHYRQVDQSNSHSSRKSIVKEFGMVYEYLWNLFEKHYFSEILLDLLQYIVLFRFLGSFNRYIFSPNKISIPTYMLKSNLLNINESIVIYGAGTVGRSIYNQLKKEKYNIIGWVDKEADKYVKKELPVDRLDILTKLSFDKLLICVKQKEIVLNIKNELIEVYGINEDKMVITDFIPFLQYCVMNTI